MYPEVFKSEQSKRTPRIELEPGRIFIMGRSIPENPSEFYRPVFDWISLYVHQNTGISKIDLGFEYINSSSTKWIFTIVKKLAEIKDIEKIAKVTWYYEQGDDDMCELGFILRSLIDCPFLVVEVKAMDNLTYGKIFSGSL